MEDGNVALDSARVAKRMNAKKVIIAYRRNEELMPARKIEVEDAKREGIEIMYNTQVIQGLTNNNLLEKVLCKKTKIENNKAIQIEESEFVLEANTVIFAIGLGIEEHILNNMNIETENGLIKIDENNMTNVIGVFAGGDLTEKKSTVARAVLSGKKTAESIHNYINNK